MVKFYKEIKGNKFNKIVILGVKICGLLGNYTASCGNYPEDSRYHQHRGGSLKLRC